MTSSASDRKSSDNPLIVSIAVVLVIYLVATVFGWTTLTHHSENTVGHDHHEAEETHLDHAVQPHWYSVIPFVLMLSAIAVFPLIRAIEPWWENNLNRFLVAVVLAVATCAYYQFFYEQAGFAAVSHTLHHAILNEYIPFIVLLFSLYTICGGIRITGDLPAHPLTNTAIISVGGAIASFVGTTGAAMLLIRLVLETNSERRYVTHTIIFFIFIVCNCGGCLLPIGDPPLFLGYLEGVDFLWTLSALWLPWLFTNAVLLLIYYVWDTIRYRQETPRDIQLDETRIRRIQTAGWFVNLPLLLGVILSVALLDPKKSIPGTNWHAPLYTREVVQLALVAISLGLGSRAVRQSNRFNYHAILEVAALFFGIFICMQPALQILEIQGAKLGIDTPVEFFWLTGSLSAILDNAPTYLVFFETADAQFPGALAELVNDPQHPSHALLRAISLGAVFMGAMTYIGNGPNFMVKAIAERTGVRMPSFFGYMLYSASVLLPVMVAVTWIFFL